MFSSNRKLPPYEEDGFWSDQHLIFWLDRVILVAFLIAVFCLTTILWPTRQEPPALLPEAFPMPIQARGISQPHLAPPPARVSPFIRQSVDNLMREGARALGKRDYAAAFQAFQKASALVPHEPGPALAKARVKRRLENLSLWDSVKNQMQTGNSPLAWRSFAEAARDDVVFFLTYAPAFSRLLESRNQIASAVSLLSTYCHLRPRVITQKKRLEALSRQLKTPKP